MPARARELLIHQACLASLVAIAIGLTGAALGCGSASPPDSSAVEAQRQLPEFGDPAAALPEGANWILVTEPRRAFVDPNLARLLAVLFPERRLDNWKERYGVDLRLVAKLAVGGYSDGSLLVARGGFDADEVVQAAVEAMDLTETVGASPRQRAVGLIGGQRYLLAAVSDDGLVLGEDAPASWGHLVRHLAGEGDSRPTSSLSSTPLRDMAEARGAPLALHVLGALDLPPDTGVGVILARTEQVALTLAKEGDSQVALWVALRGTFPSTIEDNLRVLAASLANEPLGTALGIADALPSLRLTRDDNERIVTAELRLTTSRVARGLQLLFGADLWRLLEPDSEPPPATN